MENSRNLSTVNSNKLRVKGIIYLLPGVHLRQLQRMLGISFHSTRHHVDSLSKSGEIVRLQDGRYARLYPTVTNEADRALFSMIRNKSSRKILRALAMDGGLTNKQVAEKTGLAKSTVSEYLQSFLEERVVRISLSEAGRVTYELRDRVKVLRLADDTERSMMLVAADRFVELWDF